MKVLVLLILEVQVVRLDIVDEDLLEVDVVSILGMVDSTQYICEG
jgi:hypothetical protein